ncbi:MAG TPA: hypothetical protein VF257_02935 [Solirubrobacteraceae bacterium]
MRFPSRRGDSNPRPHHYEISPPRPKLTTDAGNFGVWIVTLAAGVFLLPHIFGFVGALVDNYQYYRLAMKRRIPDGWVKQPYVETKAVFAEAIFICVIGGSMLGVLAHFNKLQ